MSSTSSVVVERTLPQAGGMTRSGVVLERIRAEFLEMPGLTLTLPQASRLWGLTTPQAETLLSELIARGFLARDPRGSYRRPRRS